MSRQTPLGAIVRGLAAGAAGTALMTAYQQALRSDGGGNGGGATDEESRWQQAPVPARVARRVLGGVFHQDVSARRTRRS